MNIYDIAMIDKRLVKESFSRAARTYDRHAGFQAEVAGMVAEAVKKAAHSEDLLKSAALAVGIGRHVTELDPPTRVLDVGCGTGSLASIIAEIFPGASIWGADISKAMLDRARKKPALEGADFAASDCDCLPFRDSTFDMVVSNMAYQWSGDITLAFSEARRVLKPGGLFAFSTLGPSTFFELKNCLREAGLTQPPHSASFKTYTEVRSSLTAPGEAGCAGLDIIAMDCRNLVRTYRDMWDLLKKVKRIGAAPRSGQGGDGLGIGTALKRASKIYRGRYPARGGGVTATYELITAVAKKNL